MYRCKDLSCNGPVKPDITFFGEQLPDQFFKGCAKINQGQPDLLIVIGTALKVAPFNACVKMLKDDVPKVLINMENTQPHVDFDNKKYPYRLFLKGKCDEIIMDLCSKIGWTNELKKLIDNGVKM